ncbi:MAG: PDZ domain-containing protein [Geobacteraceae bacterium]|nr:PDZ domain-containing protein [Geobacteraceae bacterium]
MCQTVLPITEAPCDRILAKIGISIRDVWVELNGRLGLPGEECVYVSRIEPGSVAENGGIRWGDIVLQINDVETATINDVNRAFLSLVPEVPVRLLVRRVCTKHYLELWLDYSPHGQDLAAASTTI